MIELQSVTKTYNDRGEPYRALRNITLKIDEGEQVAIVGNSGCGKSTLLNMLTGIDHPSAGTVTINGTEIHALNEGRLAEWRGRNIGIVFQFFQLIPTLTVIENLLLAMDLVKVIPVNERKNRAESLLQQMGIGRHAKKLPSSLSGGEQQRAAIARALANNPPIVIADEPTGNLDSHTATSLMMTLLNDLKSMGKTLIVVTHDKTVSRAFGRIITLNDGMVADQICNTPQQVA